MIIMFMTRDERHPIVFSGVCATSTQSHHLPRHFKRWHDGEPFALCHGEEPTDPIYYNWKPYVNNYETTMPVKNPTVARKYRQTRAPRTKIIQKGNKRRIVEDDKSSSSEV